MKFDLFLSICQSEVDGYFPSEKVMWQNFFDQVTLADELGYGTAWLAETHLSCEVQKQNRNPVIPHFKGEIGLNTDVLQLAHFVMDRTKQINIGSAIRNIICNGGPIAHAEAVRTFLNFHEFRKSTEARYLELGFAAGRFPFSNDPYGFYPKTEFEKKHWDVIRNKYFHQATEIFLRLLKGEELSSADLPKRTLQTDQGEIELESHWQFEKLAIVPRQVSLEKLKLTIGSHDPETQILANQFLPTGVFNLSITPEAQIQETHARMQKSYMGDWKRELMPRTVLIYLDEASSAKAHQQAESAWVNYWKAMEKTLDPQKVQKAVGNTLAGTPEEILEKIQSKYHPQDRLMLWFDFNNHDNESVKKSMKLFMDKIAPRLPSV